jgi:hypothetical protein
MAARAEFHGNQNLDMVALNVNLAIDKLNDILVSKSALSVISIPGIKDKPSSQSPSLRNRPWAHQRHCGSTLEQLDRRGAIGPETLERIRLMSHRSRDRQTLGNHSLGQDLDLSDPDGIKLRRWLLIGQLFQLLMRHRS